MYKNILKLLLINIFLLSGCNDATEVAKACTAEISELQNVCPVGTSAVLRAEASGSCEGSGSTDFISGDGELTGACKNQGSCEFVCVVQADRCACGIESFTNNEIVCRTCSGCGDGECSEGETPESCPIDCAAMCQVGEQRCSGDIRQECSQQGNWDSLPCPDGDTCRESPNGVICGTVCEANRTRCNGNDLQTCSLQGVWETTACPAMQSCVQEGELSSCKTLCEANISRCNGTMREVCSMAGQWESLACLEGERCVQAGEEALCEAIQSCGQEGNMRCVAGERETCTADGLWVNQACDENSYCDDASGQAICVACEDEWWLDADQDGFGTSNNPIYACSQPEGYVVASELEDCDDQNDRIYPNRFELCDRQDNDCDAQIDEVPNALCGLGEYCENGGDCALGICDVEFNVCVSGNLIVIPGGASPNGSNLSGEISETPLHTVRISRAYLMQRREVSNQDWNFIFDHNPSAIPGINRPVQNVSWYDALAYANALSQQEGIDECYDLSLCEGTPGLDFSCPSQQGSPRLLNGCFGYRLPTEAEWEHASRAGQMGWFSGHWVEDTPNNPQILAEILDPIGWYIGNSIEVNFGQNRPQDVATKDVTERPGQWQIQLNDLYDMHGNVSEWMWDVYSETAYQTRMTPCNTDEQCEMSACNDYGFCDHEIIDPVFDTQSMMEESHAIRGGAYDDLAFDCRHASRRGARGRSHNIGFRLVRAMIQR